MHPTWVHPYQSTHAAHHCHHSFIVGTHRFHEHWDNYGIGSTTQQGECFALLWPLYKTRHGIHGPWSNCKDLLHFCGRDISQSSECWPSSWVTEVPMLRVTLSKSCVSSWAYGRLGLHLTMLKPKDKLMRSPNMYAHDGKLSKDWKVDWPKHLLELVHVYNSMRSAITGYSPHYLMFGCWLCLPINFYFPTRRGTEKH